MDEKETISYQDWLIQRKAFLEESKEKRPRCKTCRKKLKGTYGVVPVQVCEPKTTEYPEEEFSPAHTRFDNGIKWKTDYMDLVGWGWRAGWDKYSGHFCNGNCAHRYAAHWANEQDCKLANFY